MLFLDCTIVLISCSIQATAGRNDKTLTVRWFQLAQVPTCPEEETVDVNEKNREGVSHNLIGQQENFLLSMSLIGTKPTQNPTVRVESH